MYCIANELKLLSLHVAAGFGMAKPYYKQKYGRRQLERLIYHLIGVGIIKEDRSYRETVKRSYRETNAWRRKSFILIFEQHYYTMPNQATLL